MDLLATFAILAATIQANPAVVLQPVASGLSNPVAIANAGDNRLFVVEQAGRIMVFDGTRVLPTPFLDIRPLVASGGERGLLGLAFHPRFPENELFYVNYTDRNGDTVVARYAVSQDDPNRADPGSQRTVLFVDQPFANHNGGQLQFGPDGYLYIGLGDGGSGGDPLNHAQNPGQLLGKMLRIDVDGGEPYAIPPSNPFAAGEFARPEIWSLGLRNPWRFSFDRATGDLWIADVGQGEWEEVDFKPASSIGGENYGWRRMEGTHCFQPRTNCGDPSFILPVIEYGHTGGACSVTGGYVYRGTQNVRLRGMYLYADFCSGVIWGATPAGNGSFVSRVLTDAGFLVSTFGEGADGEIYVANYGGGSLHRIVDTAPMLPRRRAVRH
jgi:glucose/arabinose dehydrogenase